LSGKFYKDYLYGGRKMELRKMISNLSDYELLELMDSYDEYLQSETMLDILERFIKIASETTYTRLQSIHLVVQLAYDEAVERWKRQIIQ